MALCDQLEQRSESQLAAHQTLVEALLATLTDSTDADELAQSEQFARWMQTLPSVMRDGVAYAMQDGTTAQVIEVFDAFKQQAGAAAAPHKSQAKGAPEVQRRVPNSLSEMAGEPHRDVVQQTLETAGNPAALMEAMESMTPAQIERLMNAV